MGALDTTRPLSAIEGMLEGVTFINGRICVKIDDAQQPFQVSMQDGRVVSDNTIEPSPVKPLVQAKSVRHVEEKLETMVRKTYPSARSGIWHGPPGAIKVMYAQVQKLLDWEAGIHHQGAGNQPELAKSDYETRSLE